LYANVSRLETPPTLLDNGTNRTFDGVSINSTSSSEEFF